MSETRLGRTGNLIAGMIAAIIGLCVTAILIAGTVRFVVWVWP